MAASSRTYLTNYLTWEVFLMGGLSILTCGGMWLFFEDASLVNVGLFAAALAFAVNHPHFLSSYMLLYSDYGDRILKRPSYFWAGVIAPVFILSALSWAWLNSGRTPMGYVISAMYFFVGWHYVKQVFGSVIVTSAWQKIFYKSWERRLLLTSLYTIWLVSWSKDQVAVGQFEFYGIIYPSFGIGSWLYKAAQALAGISILAVVVMQVRKYVVENVLPAPPAVAAYAALCVWMFPFFAHPGFAYMIPFFHSLQYLCFVGVLKGNEIRFEIRHLKDQAWRKAWVMKFGGYALMSLILGALFFEYIPKTLDSFKISPGAELGVQPILVSFLLFINIHHYFIDNVIWKSDNETVRKFLFSPGSPEISEIPLEKRHSA